MKKIIYLAIIAALCTTAACRKTKTDTMTVIKDCTGDYLRYNGKDYRVCNAEKIKGLSNGTTVTASFKKINNCSGPEKDRVVCYKLHPNEGWVEVKTMK